MITMMPQVLHVMQSNLKHSEYSSGGRKSTITVICWLPAVIPLRLIVWIFPIVLHLKLKWKLKGQRMIDLKVIELI